MSQCILKFPLLRPGGPVAMMPAGSRVLCVRDDAGIPFIFALATDIDAPVEKRVFQIHETEEISESIQGEYIGSIERPTGLFHVFELIWRHQQTTERQSSNEQLPI